MLAAPPEVNKEDQNADAFASICHKDNIQIQIVTLEHMIRIHVLLMYIRNMIRMYMLLILIQTYITRV